MTAARTLLLALAFSTVALPSAAQQAPRPSFEPVNVPQEPSQQAQPDATSAPTNQDTIGRDRTDYTGVYPEADRNRRTNDGSVDQATLDRAARQNQGNMTPIDRGGIAGPGVPLGTTQDAWTKPGDHMSKGQVAPGVVRFRWRPELVMPVRIREYMVTTITLPSFEKADEVLIGESMYFQGRIVRDNTVALKASASGIDTSVNVIGSSGNNYTFYVRSEPYNTKDLTDLSVFVDAAPALDDGSNWFRTQGGLNNAFPSSQGPQTPQENEDSHVIRMNAYGEGVSANNTGGQTVAESAVGSGGIVAGAQWYVPKADMAFAHRMYEVNDGDRVIAPNTVYTNGTWTFFHYGKRAATVDRPVVYRIVDGVETLVNSRWIGKHNEVLVAEATGDFVLRNGRRSVCVLRHEHRTPDTGAGHSAASGGTNTANDGSNKR